MMRTKYSGLLEIGDAVSVNTLGGRPDEITGEVSFIGDGYANVLILEDLFKPKTQLEILAGSKVTVPIETLKKL